MVIGITGLIGSGKSTASSFLKEAGFKIIDADLIGRQVVDKNQQLLSKLVKQFGADILKPNGKLNRKKLAAKAFENISSKRKLDRLVHPYLLKELKSKLREYKLKGNDVVIDAALLLDWNLEHMTDAVIMIHASFDDRVKRLKKRDFDLVDIKARQKNQLSYLEYLRRSDYMIRNNSSPDKLKQKLFRLVNNIS